MADLKGKLALVTGGARGLGQATAVELARCGARVAVADRKTEAAEETALGAHYVGLDALLRESDYVSVHAAMRPETRHLIGAREIALMKPTAILVNTARGPIVDEAALARALKEKRIAGAGLDVFENEPKVHPELVGLDSVVMVPHLGSAVSEVRETMANEVVDNILAILDGRRPPRCANPEIYA